MESNRYVQKATDGGWDVVKEGHIRATAHGATKQAAVKAARKLVLQEGGGEVHVQDHVVVDRPRPDAARPADEERHAQRFLVHEALVEPAVVAEEEALVRGVDDDGVFGQPFLIKKIE